MFKFKIRHSFLAITLLLTTANSAMPSFGKLGDLGDLNSVNKAKDLFSNKVEDFTNIDLDSLGIGDLDYENVANVNMSVFKGFLSAQCDIPMLPTISDSFCKNIFEGDFKFIENLSLGLCSVGADSTQGEAGDIMKKKDEYMEMAKQYCQDAADTFNEYAKSGNDIILGESAKTMEVLAPVDTIKSKSQYAGEREVKLNSYIAPNGLKYGDLIKPEGVMGFDKIYDADKEIPSKLRESYFNNDYTTYSLYERLAKTKKPDKNGKVNLHQISTDGVPETYLEYLQSVQVGTKETFTSMPTVYEYDKKLTNEFIKIQKEKPLNLNSSKSSIQMKADYLAYKKELSDKLMDINSTKSSYRKMIDDTAQYERLKYAEQEEIYKQNNKGYIIQPSKLKLETIPVADRPQYAQKILQQQQDEIRRGSEHLRKMKNKEELAKLMAEKVFISNFDYSSAISQKEIEEILTQASSQ